MVRRGSSRKKPSQAAHSSSAAAAAAGPVQGTVAVPAAPAIPAIPYPSVAPPSIVNPVAPAGPQGHKTCPQCHAAFNSTNCRRVQEACGHWKCRTCMIANEDGCPQCREVEPPSRGGGGLVSVGRRGVGQGRNTVEDLDLMPPVLMEEEPLAASSSSSSSEKGLRSMGQLLHESPPVLNKVGMKRKTKEASPSGPSKILKTAMMGSPTKGQRKSDPRERPKIMTRRSSSSSSVQSSSSPTSSYADGRGKVKGTRNSPTSSAKEKGSGLLSSQGKLSFGKDDNNGPSFAVTISPTTIPPKASLRTKPVLSPAKSSSKGGGGGGSSSVDDLSHFSITSVSSSGREVVVTPHGSNSNDGSSSNSTTETCDPLYISNEWNANDSNSNSTEPTQGESSEGVKKKKKRSPVTIHDHITILSGDPLLYQCNVCMKKFKTKAHIKYHEFCQNGEKPYKCEQCGQGFIAKSHYEYHLRTHTGERPYVCPKCGKGFNQRGKVTRHMRSHTGEKPFICQQCGRGFANAQALRSHFLIHTGERPFACQYCNKRFTGMTNLKKHVITHTGERPFTCNHCGKSFGLKWTLDLHLRTHSTERPFQCDQCTRAFSNSKDLRRHLVIHSGERPFKCWICGTAFRRKDNLDRHIKNTHNQPKEVAKQLANEAAAEYMAQTKATQAALAAAQATTTTTTTGVEETPSTSKKTTTTTTSSSLPSEPMVPNILARSVKKKDVIITADLSPPNSPSPAPAALGETNAVRDVYVLPNGQGQLQPAAVIHTVGADGKPTVEAHFVAVQNFEGLAELRTVPVNEYHQLEGVGLLEKAKSASPAEKEGEVIEEEHEVVEKDVKPRVVGEGDILFCGAPTGTTADGGRNLTQGLTVTVVYENDGKTHFITDQPSQYNPATVDPLSFSTDQSTGLMAIPRETLFSFASSSTTSTTPSSASAPLNSGGQENTQEDSCSSSTPSESRTSEIHLKKSETILSGNLSKYLQMDLPKNVNYSEDQDGVIPSEDDFQEEQQRVVQEDGELLNSSESRNNNEQENENSVSAQAFSSYAVKSEIDIEYVTRAVGTPDNTGEDEGADPASPLSAVSEADLEERNVAATAATGKKDEQQPDKNLEPFKVSGAKENELEEGEIERESVGKGSTANKKQDGGNEGRTNKPAPKEAAVDSTGPAAGTDAYPSDPMLQDPNADEEEERLDVEESTPQEIPPDSVTKSGEDSMLPDGMEDTYGSPGAIFADNMVGRKDDDSQCFRGIVDKECPTSILQDEPSDNNCDPISDEDDQDFVNSSSFQGPESPLEAGEIPRRRAALRKSIDMECPQLILQPEGSAAAGNELPEDPQLPEGLLFSSSLSRPPHDNDTESISSTELEPDEPNKAPETPEEEETSQAPGFKYDGTVDDVCPPSILQEDEDECKDRDVPEALPAQNPPEERPTESKGMTGEAKGRTGDSRGAPTAAKGTPTESKGTATSNLKLVPRHMENLETEQLIGDNMKGSLENEKLVVTHRNSSEDWSETEPISDTEFDPEVEDRAAASSFSFSSSSSPSTNLKRKRPEEEEERQAEKIIKNEILTAPKNALSPTAASSIIAAAAEEEEANNKLHDNEYIETSTNLNGSPERTEGGDVVKETGVSGDSLTFSVGELKECGKSPYDSDDGDDDVRILEESKGSPQGSQMHLELEENSVDENSMEGRILVSNVRSLGPETCLGNSAGTLACTSAGTSMVGSSVATSSSESVIIKTEETDPEIQTVAIIERSKTTTTETVAYEMIRETPGAMMTTQRIEMISPEPPPTAQVAYVAIPEVPPRLIYATNPLVTSTPTTILVAQPVNLTSGSSTSSSYAPPLQSQPISSRNYRIVYAPAEVASTSTAATTSYPESSQPSFRFVYENGEPMLENVEPVVDNNMRIVYACAAATADPPGNCGAQKLKLLYAEALGVGTPDESGQVQLVYTSTAPNQNLVHAPNQNVRIYSPAFLTADTDTKNIEMLIQQQQQHQQQPQVEGPGPVPVQVLYNGNGMVMAQTVGQPQDLSWIRRDLNHSFTTAASTSTTRHAPAQSEKLIPAPTTTTTAVYPSNNTRMQNINNNLASTREIIANHHNYASSPYIHVDGSKRVRFPAPFEAPAHQQAAGEPDGLRTLARAAATRMITIQADADATTRAAAAIAAVGREAQIKRQMDMLERNRNLPGGSPTTTTVFIRKGENVPHRGPRKHYLSQLTNSSRK